jgi:hypothetical protein
MVSVTVIASFRHARVASMLRQRADSKAATSASRLDKKARGVKPAVFPGRAVAINFLSRPIVLHGRGFKSFGAK